VGGRNGQGGADLYITDRCGFNCRHCFLGNELNAGRQMSVEMVRGIASFLRGAGFGEATLLGGEPFQHASIVEIAREVGSAGLRCRIVTNGYRQAHKVLRSGLLARDVEITFSIDGGREVHDAIRRRGSHSQLVETSRLAHEMGYATSGILSVSAENVDEVERVAAFCKEAGYDRLTVHHVTARGNASRDSVLGEARWRAVLETVQRLSATTRLQIRCEDPFFSLEPGAPLRCAVRDESNMMFFPDGRVYSCLLFIDSEGGSGAYWDGRSVVRVRPRRGELDACLGAGGSSSCPASAALQPPLYPGAAAARIRCIYDKVPLGPALPA
jgi:MoaA/NifB/PqqE/SkfB family radical SAM enzyme